METLSYIYPPLLFVLGIIGYFLRQKDLQQQTSINSLQSQRDMDAKVIQTITLQIASALETVTYIQNENRRLFELHDRDAAALNDLKLQIANEHYQKRELDGKFDKLDITFRDGLKNLGDKFDNFSQSMLEYMAERK
jgi:hypothetical protein